MIMQENKDIKKLRARNDVILIIALLLAAGIAFVYLFVFRGKGNLVKITVDGELYGTYDLSSDISQDIRSGKNGQELNRFVISDGKVYMEHASCPDGICVSHRAIFRDGESIVCLPNRVVITVVTEDKTDSADIVA